MIIKESAKVAKNRDQKIVTILHINQLDLMYRLSYSSDVCLAEIEVDGIHYCKKCGCTT